MEHYPPSVPPGGGGGGGGIFPSSPQQACGFRSSSDNCCGVHDKYAIFSKTAATIIYNFFISSFFKFDNGLAVPTWVGMRYCLVRRRLSRFLGSWSTIANKYDYFPVVIRFCIAAPVMDQFSQALLRVGQQLILQQMKKNIFVMFGKRFEEFWKCFRNYFPNIFQEVSYF